jgi:BMFP domain-containing protein YqiC
MPTGSNRILDEFAKLVTDAAGAARGVRREVENAFKAQAERVLNSMEVVQREEFDAVREMALKARAENRKLETRIAELEAKLSRTLGEEPVAASEAAPKRSTKPSPKK